MIFSYLGGSDGKFKVLTVSAEQLSTSTNAAARRLQERTASKSEGSVKFVFVDSLGDNLKDVLS